MTYFPLEVPNGRRKTGEVMEERRVHARAEVYHPVLYATGACPTKRVGSAFNLSMGGIKIETLHDLRPGEHIEVAIGLHPEVIRCRGEVVHAAWADGERLQAGIRFDDLSDRDRLYLGEYMAYMMEQCLPEGTV